VSKQSLAIPAIISCLLSSAASAEPDTTTRSYVAEGCRLLAHTDLSQLTHKNEDVVRQFWMCAGAMEATIQLMKLHHEVCLPPKLQHIEIAQVISSYMDSHAERPEEAYGIVMFRSLQQQWPCPKAEK